MLDTLGLGSLGLPDFEVALGERMPQAFELALRSLARYQYDMGDVIAEGRTIKAGAEAFQLAIGSSSVDPKRDVFILKKP